MIWQEISIDPFLLLREFPSLWKWTNEQSRKEFPVPERMEIIMDILSIPIVNGEIMKRLFGVFREEQIQNEQFK